MPGAAEGGGAGDRGVQRWEGGTILPFPRIFSFFHFMLEQESTTQESMTHPNLSFSTLQPNFLD